MVVVSKTKIPKFIKFSYRNKELLWLKLNKYENNYYYLYFIKKPLSKGITINISKYIKTKF